jgi:hypothetical protein
MGAPDFGALRSAAHDVSARGWGEVRAELERASRAGHGRWVAEKAVPYLRGALRAWPDELLCLPSSAQLTGREVDAWPPWYELVRDVDMSRAAPWLMATRVVDVLLQTPLLDGATRLSLAGRRLDLRNLSRLLDSPRFASVRALDLTLCGLGDAGVAALIARPGGWDELVLDKNGLTAQGTHALAYWDGLGDLERLSVAGNPELDAAVLLRSSALHALHGLDVSGCRVGAEAVDELVGAPWLPGLEELAISNVTLRPDAIMRLLSASGLSGVRSLALRGAPLGSVWLPTVIERRSFRALERLDLSSCMLRNPDVRLLAHSGEWPELRRLNLSGNAITDSAIQDIAQNARWPRLEQLGLYNCRFTSRGTVGKLKQAPGLPSLHTISR